MLGVGGPRFLVGGPGGPTLGLGKGPTPFTRGAGALTGGLGNCPGPFTTGALTGPAPGLKLGGPGGPGGPGGLGLSPAPFRGLGGPPGPKFGGLRGPLGGLTCPEPVNW